MDDYEFITYESLSFADTHPDRLTVLGQVFGLQAPAVETCRVLELGCAEGGNIIPMASSLPNAQFIGVDLSAAQTARGIKNITELGLTNIVIQHGNILDLGEELGTFDYIIAHGVLSWVDTPVREKLMASIHDLLNPNGLAYVSYNVNPGWRLKGVLRDLLLYHVRNVDQPVQRLEKAQELLRIIGPSLSNAGNTLIRFMAEQIHKLANEDPSYLYHEYLELTNQPMLFSEFVDMANRHGLQYLCDSELYTMFASSLGGQTAEFIEGFDELVEQEQYMDFLRGRGFRQSILCHDTATPNYDIDLTFLESLSVYADVLDSPQATDTFTAANGEGFKVTEPLTKAMLQYLSEVYPDSVPLSELRQVALQRIPSAVSENMESEAWQGELFNLYANGLIGLSTRTKRYSVPDYEYPHVNTLTSLQAAQGSNNLTTVWHQNLNVDPFASRFIHYLDGTRSLDDIVELLTHEVNAGTLILNETSSPDSATQYDRDDVKNNCERLLKLFRRHGLIAADALQMHGHVA